MEIFLAGEIEQEHINKLKDLKGIVVKGFIEPEELANYYRSLDIFVYKKDREGFGLIPLEAMASGCAVIVSGVASLPEVVGDNGILISNDEETFYYWIKELIEKKGKREYLKRQGRKRAEELTWEKCGKNVLKVYGEVLKE